MIIVGRRDDFPVSVRKGSLSLLFLVEGWADEHFLGARRLGLGVGIYSTYRC